MFWLFFNDVSLRVRLALLVMFAMLPLAGTLLGDLITDRADALDAARQRAVALARLGAEQQDSLLQEARTILAVLSRVPQVTAAAPDTCYSLLRQLVTDHPRLASLLVTDGDGQVTCNSMTAHPKFSVGDRRFVRQLLQPGAHGYELSDVAISLATRRPALFVGLALPPAWDSGPPAGVVAAGLNLDWLQGMAAKLAQDSNGQDGNGTAAVLDARDGAVIARSAGEPSAPAGPARGHPALQAYLLASGQSGTADGTGPDGVERVYGYAPLPGTDGGAILAVGFSRDQVLSYATGRMMTALSAVLAALAAAVGCTLLAAWRMLIRPLEMIMRMAGRLSAGDLSARVSLPHQHAQELRLLGVALNALAAALANSQSMQAEIEDRLRRLAGIDGLTGLPNRRMFDETYEREWRRSSRDGALLSLLLLDVDHFKLFNDRYGHLAGDDCLRTIGAAAAAACRSGDLLARFGGEEFVILLPGANPAEAAAVAERVRASVAALRLEHAGNLACGGRVTVSLGQATTRPRLEDDQAGKGPRRPALDPKAKLLADADAALYAAKARGRNQVGTATRVRSDPVC